ncbi:MAG TPA: xanthine dehydrogenase family protein molybdopterin-binding subunit [Acidimicrobiia bacterium]|nr:xanthine dehydrogenase family protein molybdopterin-binding subunit [Acidimicrobiia bacterium]
MTRTGTGQTASTTAPTTPASTWTPAPAGTWVGLPVERVEDDALLRGEGWFMDDLDPLPHIAEAAVVRSTEAHARIVSVDVSAALEMPGVVGVLTGDDVAALSRPFPSAIGRAVEHWAAAVGVVRYVGEPVAVVVARDRYVAEDAAERVTVEYDPLPVAASPEAALAPGAPVLHDAVGNNVVSDRRFSYGDAVSALAGADLVVRRRFRHPRSSCTPVEGFGVICAWDATAGSVTAWSNFQGPFTLHGVAAAALGVAPAKLRLVSPPDSGGSFGVKAAVFTSVVLMAIASRRFGVPVRWTEDRVEHLLASSMATERLSEVEAGFTASGDLVALRLDLVDDVGAYVRAPEPATLYRMHGCITGPYRVSDVSVRSRVVVTNRCPTGLNRGFGGPQLSFALERTMAIAAARLGLDPAVLIRRNLVPASAMPYRAPAGAVYDSGDYAACLDRALELANYPGLRREQAERGRPPHLATLDVAKCPPSPGERVVGVGIACVVEPSASNMGYITLVDPPERRATTLPKDGNAETVTIAMDPGGGVTVAFTSTPQGQGHRTVAAQIVADVLGVRPGDVTVLPGADTTARAFTVSSGNYSSRFAVTVASAVHVAALRLAERVRAVAAPMLESAPEDLELVDGVVRVQAGSDRSVSLRRVAGAAHWDPAGLPAGVDGLALTATFSVPGLAAPTPDDTVNSSAAYGFLADVAVVEVDMATGEVRVRDYVTVHDAGRVLHPALAEGQVLGGLAHGIGAALLERHVYDDAGNLLTTTFVDYPTPTATELPRPTTAMVESLSPVTPLGAKGLGEGTTMTAPAAIANAVADALGLDALPEEIDLELPLTPARVWALVEAIRRLPVVPEDGA